MTVGVSGADGLARLTISDNGDGVSDNNRDRIFDSFFTTGRETGGAGMGLARRDIRADAADCVMRLP